MRRRPGVGARRADSPACRIRPWFSLCPRQASRMGAHGDTASPWLVPGCSSVGRAGRGDSPQAGASALAPAPGGSPRLCPVLGTENRDAPVQQDPNQGRQWVGVICRSPAVPHHRSPPPRPGTALASSCGAGECRGTFAGASSAAAAQAWIFSTALSATTVTAMGLGT